MKPDRLTGAGGASAEARAAAGLRLVDIFDAPATPLARASDSRDAAEHAFTAN